MEELQKTQREYLFVDINDTTEIEARLDRQTFDIKRVGSLCLTSSA